MTTLAAQTNTVASRRWITFVYKYGVYLLFLAMIVFFAIANPRFFSVANLLNILQQAAPIGIATIGMTFVLVIAGIDISVGQNMYLSAILVAVAMERMNAAGWLGSIGSYVVFYAIALGTGALVGAFNGLLVARMRIIPFIATLATMGIARGIGLIASDSKVYYVEQLSPISNGRFLGVPYVVIILIVLLLVLDHILRRTPYGRQLMAIGNDSTAAARIGINVVRNKWIAYILCGTLAGLAGVLLAGQVANVAVYFADGTEFLVISAAVLGGTSLFGGKGSVIPGALVGVLLVTTIVNGMTMMNVSPYAYKIVRGAIIFLAVMVDSVNYKGELG